MTISIESPVLLTVRGTTVPATLESARVLHNETAGSAPGIAAARGLGDLSHKVYAPCRDSKHSSAKAGELLFIDNWVDPKGIMEFFSNAHVQEQGTRLFKSKTPTVWMKARGSLSYDLPAPAGKNERYVGMLRVQIGSPEKAIEVFREVDQSAMKDARRRGLMSHQLFIKLNAPGDNAPLELLGVDQWFDLAGLTEHYDDQRHMSALGSVFAGTPDATVWEQAPGSWSEW
jgi:hypothetical protein